MNPVQGFSGKWRCGRCFNPAEDEAAAEACCKVSDEQEAFTLEELEPE